MLRIATCHAVQICPMDSVESAGLPLETSPNPSKVRSALNDVRSNSNWLVPQGMMACTRCKYQAMAPSWSVCQHIIPVNSVLPL